MQEAKRSPLLDSLKIVGLAIMACYVCRFWPMVIFLVIYGLAVITRTLVKSRKAKTAKLVPVIPAEPIPAPTPTQRDMENLAFSMICGRITELVARDYPNARWVWEFPTAQKLILEGHEAYILLNQAGGYRRAQVLYQNLQVTGLKYEGIAVAPAACRPFAGRNRAGQLHPSCLPVGGRSHSGLDRTVRGGPAKWPGPCAGAGD